MAYISMVLALLLLIQSYRVWDYKDDVDELNTTIETLTLGNQTLKSNLEAQNQKMIDLHMQYLRDKESYEYTTKQLQGKLDKAIAQINKNYSGVKINDADEAIEWLRGRSFQWFR